MPASEHVVTNGEGYVYHDLHGLHVMHEEEIHEFVQRLKDEAPNDKARFYVYRLEPVDWEA